MEYPPEVKERVDSLAQYKVNENLDTCHTMHLYAEGLAFPNGYYDSQFFTLVIYDTSKMEKREITGRDGVDIETKKTHAKMVRIFADGSTMVKFDNVVKVGIFQSVTVYEAQQGVHPTLGGRCLLQCTFCGGIIPDHNLPCPAAQSG